MTPASRFKAISRASDSTDCLCNENLRKIVSCLF